MKRIPKLVMQSPSNNTDSASSYPAFVVSFIIFLEFFYSSLSLSLSPSRIVRQSIWFWIFFFRLFSFSCCIGCRVKRECVTLNHHLLAIYSLYICLVVVVVVKPLNFQLCMHGSWDDNDYNNHDDVDCRWWFVPAAMPHSSRDRANVQKVNKRSESERKGNEWNKEFWDDFYYDNDEWIEPVSIEMNKRTKHIARPSHWLSTHSLCCTHNALRPFNWAIERIYSRLEKSLLFFFF